MFKGKNGLRHMLVLVIISVTLVGNNAFTFEIDWKKVASVFGYIVNTTFDNADKTRSSKSSSKGDKESNGKYKKKKLKNLGNTTVAQIISKNKKSYTAGTGSVYGPKLDQSQLNEVAREVTYFKNNYISDDMDNNTKIRIANEYLKAKVSYIDWREGFKANTAYGALNRNLAACSGYARAFKALMDGIDVSAYYIHADKKEPVAPNHQWNMVEYNDGYYFIDVTYNDYHSIDSNGKIIDIPDGEDLVYHSSTHPHMYDASKLPKVGSKSKNKN